MTGRARWTPGDYVDIGDNVYEGLLVVTPENVPGATCGSSPPTLLGGRSVKPRG